MTQLIHSLHKIACFLSSLFNKTIGKSTLGVRAIVIDADQKVLLVKHTYQPGWYLPGGGVKKNEALPKTIVRELREEAGVEVLEDPNLFGIYLRIANGVADYPAVYIVKKYQLFESKSPEIKEKGWFDYHQLPSDTTKATQRRLQEFFERTPKSYIW